MTHEISRWCKTQDMQACKCGDEHGLEPECVTVWCSGVYRALFRHSNKSTTSDCCLCPNATTRRPTHGSSSWGPKYQHIRSRVRPWSHRLALSMARKKMWGNCLNAVLC